MSGHEAGSRRVIYAALAGNIAIAVTKFAAALWTGSSAMLSEGLHSLVDTSNEGLLLFGMRRAARPADRSHPFGYGMELYFWAFVVALLIFALGGAVSIYEGVLKILKPEPLTDPWVNFVVLAACILFEALSFRVAWRELRARYPDLHPWRAVKASKDPSVFAVLLEDAAALVGLSVALVGLGLEYLLDAPVLDGAASVGIGLVLVVTAVVLSREILSLMTGESASREVLDAARALLVRDPRVEAIQELLSLHLGPRDILLAVAIDFRDELTGGEIEAAARELTAVLREGQPSITRVFLRPVER